MAMSLVISAAAIALTFVIGHKINQREEAPTRKTETAKAIVTRGAPFSRSSGEREASDSGWRENVTPVPHVRHR